MRVSRHTNFSIRELRIILRDSDIKTFYITETPETDGISWNELLETLQRELGFLDLALNIFTPLREHVNLRANPSNQINFPRVPAIPPATKHTELSYHQQDDKIIIRTTPIFEECSAENPETNREVNVPVFEPLPDLSLERPPVHNEDRENPNDPKLRIGSEPDKQPCLEPSLISPHDNSFSRDPRSKSPVLSPNHDYLYESPESECNKSRFLNPRPCQP